MDTTSVDRSAPHDHNEGDATLEMHASCLERLEDSQGLPHGCYDGWVFLGRIIESEHDLDGEVVEYERVPCRRCQRSLDSR